MTRITRFSIALLSGAMARAGVVATQPTTNGWTALTPGQHQIHVSSSLGNDSNDATPAHPLKTLAAGIARVHDHDDLLLKRGDVFPGWIGGKWHDVTVGAWGAGERPIILGGTSSNCGALFLNVRDVRLVGLHFLAAHRDPSKADFKLVAGGYGIYCNNCDDVLIEDCLIEFFAFDVCIQGSASKGLRVRRGVIRNAYSDGKGYSQCLYMDGQVNALIEECVFDTCGWDPLLQGEWERRNSDARTRGREIQNFDAETRGRGDTEKEPQPVNAPSSNPSASPHLRVTASSQPASPAWLVNLQPWPGQPFPGLANMFNHGIYDSDAKNAGPSIIRNCIFVNCAASGVTQNAGGVIDNCLFIHNGMAADAWTGGPTGQIVNCVCLGSTQCPTWAAGGGLALLSKSGKVQNNVIAHGAPPQRGGALVLWMNKGAENQVPPDARALFRHNVVFDWPGDGFTLSTARSHIDFCDNRLCRIGAHAVSIVDPADAEYVFEANAYEGGTGQFAFQSKATGFDAFQQAIGANSSQLLAPGTTRFVDPGRTIESYAASIGLPAALRAFTSAAEGQSRQAWDPRLTAAGVNDYVRAGFVAAKVK